VLYIAERDASVVQSIECAHLRRVRPVHFSARNTCDSMNICDIIAQNADGGCAETHKTKTGTKPNTEQAAQTDRSPPRPPRGNKESREDYFFKGGPHFGEVIPISLRPRCLGWVTPYIFL
jgi:hypothetical protein